MELIAQGAEAKLYSDGERILKERISKSYRVPELDKSLRQHRTRREAKVLTKLKQIGVLAPELQEMCDKKMQVSMSFLAGEKLKDVFQEKYAKQAGKLAGKMHSEHIIHSDLTTSNMIVVDGQVHMIDFGLSFFSHKPEDKAVDLHLFKRALDSAHHEIALEAWNAFIEGYKEEYSEHPAVFKRLEAVEKRGRHKKK